MMSEVVKLLKMPIKGVECTFKGLKCNNFHSTCGKHRIYESFNFVVFSYWFYDQSKLFHSF